MKKLSLFVAATTLLVSLAVAHSWASVPSIDYSTVAWHNSYSKPFISPSGNGSFLEVIVRDQFNLPMGGAPVAASFTSPCNVHFCSPVSGITDLNGRAYLQIHAGADATASQACCAVITRVTCLGIIISSDTSEWVSPDLNGDGTVGSPDFAIFSGDLNTNACRSNFDGLDGVDAADSQIFASDLGSACAGGGVKVTKKPPPNRDGDKPGDKKSCPPGPDAHTKGIPDKNLGDDNVSGHSDGTLDFFMGEWRFDLGGKDLIVQKWAINQKPAPNGQFEDYFSYRILTSDDSWDPKERVAIPAGTPT